MKIFAYTLLILGPIMMLLSRPFTDHTDAPVVLSGAAIAIVGVFLWSRLRRGIPMVSVTDEDRAQLKDLRRELGLRRMLGRFLGSLGALTLIAGLAQPLYSQGAQYDWSVSAFALLLASIFIACAKPLLRRSA